MNNPYSHAQCERSQSLWNRAQHYMPGGVNSPVRAFGAVGGIPRWIHSANGAYLTDVDGHQLIDYVNSWGAMIVGHAHPKVLAAVNQAINQGLSFGAPCEAEIVLAQMISELIDSIDTIRMVNSGTEAVMTAIRLARAYTHREKLIKLAGCYHGHSDALLVNAGSGALTLGCPNSPGVTQASAQDTLVAQFNDLDSVVACFEQYPHEVAAVIVEPIAANMNLIPPQPEFLLGLAQLCRHYEALLIFDEVITGFRVAAGGAQALYDIHPDLTCLGKIIGAGMPVGALGGRLEIMNQLAPEGSVYQAGTLSGNPVAMAAGIASLTLVQANGFYDQLATMTQKLAEGLHYLAQRKKIPLCVHHCCGLLGLVFSQAPSITRLEQVTTSNKQRFRYFFHAMLRAGVYLPPSAFECCFLSSSHSNQDINKTLNAAEYAFEYLSSKNMSVL